MRKDLKGQKVLIGPSSFSAIDKSPLDLLRDAGFEIVGNPFKRKLTKAELCELLSGKVTGLIAGLESLDRDVLKGSDLKVISRCGSGMSNVDLSAARELGIKVFSTPDAPVSAVSELTVGALLSILRSIPAMDRDLHEGKWNKIIGRQLQGKTVVIIGFGRIGRKVAELLRPFDAKIIAVDPCVKRGAGGIKVLPLHDALKEADVISVHASGEGQLIGGKEFGVMKKGTFLLNASRGGIIDETALVQALEQGKIAGAWVDTFNAEPYEGPLSKYPQVLLTPHVGSYTAECRKSMEMQAVINLISGFR